MFYVYVLKSLKDRKLYTGFTRNVKRRVEAHNSGMNKSTRFRVPLVLVYTESYLDEKEARLRERFLKSGKGRKFLKSKVSALDSVIGGISSIG